MNFDTTAFQSVYALADYGLTHPMADGAGEWRDRNSGEVYRHPVIERGAFTSAMKRALKANLAARSTNTTTFYQLGSDYRGGSLRYLLSYMSQMGGLPILDYGLNHADRPAPYLWLGYASLLSA